MKELRPAHNKTSNKLAYLNSSDFLLMESTSMVETELLSFDCSFLFVESPQETLRDSYCLSTYHRQADSDRHGRSSSGTCTEDAVRCDLSISDNEFG